MPRFVSWLNRAVDEFPQAKASAEQWLAGLRKSPIVNQEEVANRGLEEFLTGQQGTVDRSTIQGYLADNPMPMADPLEVQPLYANYSTPGMGPYDETVYHDPKWDPRSVSSHFEAYSDEFDDIKDIKGYQFHTRSGVLPNTNLGRVGVLDELQTDVEPGTWSKAFNPAGAKPGVKGPGDMEISSALGQFIRRQGDFGLTMPEIQAMAPWGGESGVRNWPGRPAANPEEVLAATRNMRARAETEGWLDDPQGAPYYTPRTGLDRLEELGQQALAARDTPENPMMNLPGRESWKWHGMARALEDSVSNNRDALVWPSADVQYKRYYQRAPELYEARRRDTQEALERGYSDYSADTPEEQMAALQQDADAAREMANSSAGSMQLYRNQYDKEMPRHKRWKQLGLEPKLVDLEDSGKVRLPGSGRSLGKYWAVQLTPEIKAKLKESGIPYYAVGGTAILGMDEEEGALY